MTIKLNTVSFEISTDLLASLNMGVSTLGQQIRLIAAISYFREKKLSLGKAAQLAGVNRLLFMDMLAERGLIIFDYDETELEAELEGVKQLAYDYL